MIHPKKHMAMRDSMLDEMSRGVTRTEGARGRIFARLGAAAVLALGLVTGFEPAFAETSDSTSGAAVEEHEAIPPRQSWSFYGPFGKFDQAQLQRGFQVFKEVCSNCHSMKLLAFRNLSDPGGPGFTEGQVKALAETYKIKDGPNDAGEMFERPGRPSDYFPWVFANPQAAIAALTALPPDMSVLAKARAVPRGFPWFIIDPLIQYQEQGPDYIYSIIMGYDHADDSNYNEMYPGHKIAMPKPLSDGQVDYSDGSPKTTEQYARDVSAFLMWTAEPKLMERKRTGFRVTIFLVVFAGLLYFVKKRIWSNVHGGDVVVGTH